MNQSSGSSEPLLLSDCTCPPRPVAWTSRSKDFVLKIWRRKFTRGICRGIPFLPRGTKTKPPDGFGVSSLGVWPRTCCQPVPHLVRVLCLKEGQWATTS